MARRVPHPSLRVVLPSPGPQAEIDLTAVIRRGRCLFDSHGVDFGLSTAEGVFDRRVPATQPKVTPWASGSSEE